MRSMTKLRQALFELQGKVIFEQETDGRWLAEVPELPGVMAYGLTEHEAEAAVLALALRVLAERI
jgi:predicted RNase H-like HicB family nuclease